MALGLFPAVSGSPFLVGLGEVLGGLREFRLAGVRVVLAGTVRVVGAVASMIIVARSASANDRGAATGNENVTGGIG
ncbi:hypothetical protein MXD61_01780 [Frankia sp. AgPm24]|uniref:Uncharacterized protein n=1 Tax=Frankia umida TaxID=573489 RepID=A0ABT0JWU8_9ACTN|nr:MULTISPECIES: hypothetical protein [Frankia]MCK9875890.1 hypothetical protein [Frankia umida]MCK9920650.1 hypothetical protein [Frankia sp. AgPm24]